MVGFKRRKKLVQRNDFKKVRVKSNESKIYIKSDEYRKRYGLTMSLDGISPVVRGDKRTQSNYIHDFKLFISSYCLFIMKC